MQTWHISLFTSIQLCVCCCLRFCQHIACLPNVQSSAHLKRMRSDCLMTSVVESHHTEARRYRTLGRAESRCRSPVSRGSLFDMNRSTIHHSELCFDGLDILRVKNHGLRGIDGQTRSPAAHPGSCFHARDARSSHFMPYTWTRSLLDAERSRYASFRRSDIRRVESTAKRLPQTPESSLSLSISASSLGSMTGNHP